MAAFCLNKGAGDKHVSGKREIRRCCEKIAKNEGHLIENCFQLIDDPEWDKGKRAIKG